MGDRNYYIAGVLIIILAMIPFFAGFESCRPEARELVTIAVMCAIAVASRIVFIMLPGFKPVVAIIMITGMAFVTFSRIPYRGYGRFCQQFRFRTGAVDSMADVRLRHSGIHIRTAVRQGTGESGSRTSVRFQRREGH